MIVNLAIQTRQIIADAKLNINEIVYVIFYNEEAGEYQYCSFDEFMDTAEDVDYDELDPTFMGRRIIQPSLAIVAENWWLRRTTDEEDVEGWVYQDIPLSMNEIQEGSGEFDVNYVISDIDVLPSDYQDLIGTRMEYNNYVKPANILINGKQYIVSDVDGIDKVYDGGNVAVIRATDSGQYWTHDNSCVKDPRMLFHPQLVKSVMEESYADIDSFKLLDIAKSLGISTVGFEDIQFTKLTIAWIPQGSEFSIVYDAVNDLEQMEEQIIINAKNWLIS